MASKYAKEFKVPEGFPETLRDFTREVLRDQPAEIDKYGRGGADSHHHLSLAPSSLSPPRATVTTTTTTTAATAAAAATQATTTS